MNTHTSQFRVRSTILAVAIAAILFIGAGITGAAAQSAIPGDALYPVKTGIEQTRLSLAQDAGDRAQMKMVFAEQRLKEIEALIAEGRYREISQAVLAFEADINNAILELEMVAEGDPVRAAQIAREVTAALTRYAQTLSTLATGAPESVRLDVARALDTTRVAGSLDLPSDDDASDDNSNGSGDDDLSDDNSNGNGDDDLSDDDSNGNGNGDDDLSDDDSNGNGDDDANDDDSNNNGDDDLSDDNANSNGDDSNDDDSNANGDDDLSDDDSNGNGNGDDDLSDDDSNSNGDDDPSDDNNSNSSGDDDLSDDDSSNDNGGSENENENEDDGDDDSSNDNGDDSGGDNSGSGS